MWFLGIGTDDSQCGSLLYRLLLSQLPNEPVVIVISFLTGGLVIVSYLVGDAVDAGIAPWLSDSVLVSGLEGISRPSRELS